MQFYTSIDLNSKCNDIPRGVKNSLKLAAAKKNRKKKKSLRKTNVTTYRLIKRTSSWGQVKKPSGGNKGNEEK